MRTNAPRAQRGITLIELLVAVAIVAILGSIAVANYRGSVLRSNRAEATAALLRVQAAQEKYYLSRHTYTNNLQLLGSSPNTERGLYTIQIQLKAGTDGYTVSATPTGSQAADTECPQFTIDEAGDRTPTPGTTNKCWR